MRQIRHLEVLILTMLIAVAIRLYPLQHHMTLSRYQHWGIALYIWGLGFYIQAIWSWRQLTGRGRIALLASGTYVSALAMMLYTNPWLDTTVSLQTSEQEDSRFFISVGFALAAVVVGILWLRWGLFDLSGADHKEQSQ